MKQKTLLLFSIFLMLFFASFVSKNSSEISPTKKQSSQTIKTKTLKSVFINKKQKKPSLKERTALKLINKKIQKAKKKPIKRPLFDVVFISVFAALILAGLVSGIVYLALGKTLLGVLLLLGGLIVIPIIFGIIVIGFNLPHREMCRKKFKEYKKLKKQ